MSLEETYYAKLKEANEIEWLLHFIFEHDGEYYLVKFEKGLRWSEPIKVKML